MRSLRRRLTLPVAAGVLGLAAGAAQAQNLLTNGDFETAPPVEMEIPEWSLKETITGMPGVSVNSAQQEGFANQPEPVEGEFGLWLRPFEGNLGGLMNEKTNAVLSQTVPGTAGEDYTFTGWSRFEPNYSGAVDFLDAASPTGMAGGDLASPTESIWELAFLDASSAVIGTPVTFDLRTEQFGDNTWRQHTVTGTAPTGTASVRVTASALDMIANIDPQQSGFYDNFSLTPGSAPATELLSNADLNEAPPPPPEVVGWTIIETPEGTDTAGIGGDFANDPATDGSSGFWLKAFANGDAILTQTVAGVEGGNYTFAASSAFGQNYSGGLPETTTETFLELAFLDADEEVIGDPLTLDLVAEGQTNAAGPIGDHPEAWQQFSLDGVAPAGTAFVQVSAGATGMFATEDPDQGAFFDDLSLVLESALLPGDYNNNGIVDAADYTVWRDNLGSMETLPNDPIGGEIGQDQYDQWVANFGQTAPGSGAVVGASAVPEPACWMLAMIALAVGAAMHRRW